MIKNIAFDADDTLWHNERIFIETKSKYTNLLSAYHSPEWIEERLDEAESRNIQHFGYGIKGFTLSMIETACELTEGRVNGNEIQQIIGFGREMLAAPINLLDGVRETIHELSHQFDLMLITKGDLFDQEAKLARSGIGSYFKTVEIISQKEASDYQKILNRYQIKPEEFIMIGNSLKSDILPVLEIGGNAIYVAYETEWAHERVSESELQGKDFARLNQMSELIDWLKML